MYENFTKRFEPFGIKVLNKFLDLFQIKKN